MIRNYVTSIIRYVLNNKTFTAINICGLAIGMIACILISEFVVHEFSYDNFIDKKERIFRLQLDRYDKGKLATQWASGCAGIGPDLKENFPEVEAYTRLRSARSMFSVGDKYFNEDNVYFASEDFFNVFSIHLKNGIDSSVLKKPFSIVLSEQLAKKYFGDENPVGKIIRNRNEHDYEVTGVFDDLPSNTHFKIDALLSFSSLTTINNDPMLSWFWDGFFTYVLLREESSVREFQAKLPEFVKNKLKEEHNPLQPGMVFHLQPLTSIHLDSDYIGEFKPNGNRKSVYFLSVVAVLILFIAWINYVNLSTAKSIERAREVGVRKVMGSFKMQLIQQFLLESFLLNVLAIGIAIAVSVMLTPWFSTVTDRPLDLHFFTNVKFWLVVSVIVLLGTATSGIYPSFVLSSYKPVDVLKGRFKNTGKGIAFRRGMVIGQFIASIVLIIGTFTVYRQISFMKGQELGVNIEQTLILHSPGAVDSTYQNKFQVFKQRLKQFAEVKEVAASNSVPGSSPQWNAGGIRLLSQREDEANQYRVIMMDDGFIPLYGLDLVAGRGFNSELKAEERNVLLNESATRLMGLASPETAINDRIFFWGDTFRIVGVLKDYHQESLKKSFEPLVFRYSPAPGGRYSIRFNTSNVKTSISKFEETWRDVFPGNPFVYFFLDEHYNQQYKADQQFGNIFGIFSALAIFIACLGLFGLSSLSVIQRTKEIGVRKVLGASVPGILILISRDYILLMLVAIGVATPLAWWVMNQWLESFAYRISLTFIIFFLPALVVVLVAMITVGIHTVRAAKSNPVKSLRYE